jgi:hypothetical protein
MHTDELDNTIFETHTQTVAFRTTLRSWHTNELHDHRSNFAAAALSIECRKQIQVHQEETSTPERGPRKLAVIPANILDQIATILEEDKTHLPKFSQVLKHISIHGKVYRTLDTDKRGGNSRLQYQDLSDENAPQKKIAVLYAIHRVSFQSNDGQSCEKVFLVVRNFDAIETPYSWAVDGSVLGLVFLQCNPCEEDRVILMDEVMCQVAYLRVKLQAITFDMTIPLDRVSKHVLHFNY